MLPSTGSVHATSRRCGRSTTCSAGESGSGPCRQRRGVDQVPGRRPRLAGSPHGEHPGQHGSLRGQPGATEHQPQNQGGVGRRQGEGKELGRPRRITDEQLTAIRRDLEDEMPLAAVARKYGVPRSTLQERSTVPTRLGRIRLAANYPALGIPRNCRVAPNPCATNSPRSFCATIIVERSF